MIKLRKRKSLYWIINLEWTKPCFIILHSTKVGVAPNCVKENITSSRVLMLVDMMWRWWRLHIQIELRQDSWKPANPMSKKQSALAESFRKMLPKMGSGTIYSFVPQVFGEWSSGKHVQMIWNGIVLDISGSRLTWIWHLMSFGNGGNCVPQTYKNTDCHYHHDPIAKIVRGGY